MKAINWFWNMMMRWAEAVEKGQIDRARRLIKQQGYIE